MNSGLQPGGAGSGSGSGSGSSSSIAQDDITQLLQALELIYSPKTSNAHRKEATLYLDEFKTRPSAPTSGFDLASDASRPAVVRHYGLSLLEFFIKYRWEDCSEAELEAIKQWVQKLAHAVDSHDPAFYRNKVAQLWTEVAKRFWIDHWEDMDKALVELWHKSYHHRDVVLQVLEVLSDEAFSRDDGLSTVRGGGDLGKACIEIFTPAEVWSELFPGRESGLGLRCGDDGWLLRLTNLLQWCMEQNTEADAEARDAALSAFALLRSVMTWIVPRVVARTRCVELCCQCLSKADVELRMGAVETFHALYHRTHFEDDDVTALVCPLLGDRGLSMLRDIYESLCVSVDDLDESKYAVLKKFTEVACALASFAEQRPVLVAKSSDVEGLLRLLAEILQNPSLVVSIPILYIWTKLLGSRTISKAPAITSLIGGLLENCSNRLLRYEALPSDSQDTTVRFLAEDFDTAPERHAFVGNYRRFCMDLIERVVRLSPFEAIRHIIRQADALVKDLYAQNDAFKKEEFSSNSLNLLRLDAQATVVTTAQKGYMRWYTAHGQMESAQVESHSSLMSDLTEWCLELLRLRFNDPPMAKRILQLVVEMATNALPSSSPVPLAACELIFTGTPLSDRNSQTPYDEALRELEAAQPRELQKLALRFHNGFMAVFPQLEQGMDKFTSHPGFDQRIRLDYQAFLFTVVQRTSAIDDQEKAARIKAMMHPVLDAWRDEQMRNAIQDFEGFCRLLGLDQFPNYFLSNKAQSIADWSTVPLSPEARSLRETITSKTDELPLAATRSFLAASTERVKQGSREFELVKSEWREGVPVILPSVLQLLSHAHGFNNPSKWDKFAGEMQDIVRRTLVDRVWQSGISNESRDDFYARVRDSKMTMEGFASAVRASVRQVRELSYWILHCMTAFGDAFYGHEDLPEPMARALYADAHALSAHQMSTLLRLSQAVIDGCPAEHRASFLPRPLVALFQQLDYKITADWEALERRKAAATDDVALDAEMKAESVLRQLSHSAVLLVAHLLKPPQRAAAAADGNVDWQLDDGRSMRALILSSPTILEPLILFCTNALRIKDHRCCSIITRTLRGIIPEFSADPIPGASRTSPPAPRELGSIIDAETSRQAREYISSSIVKAAITSLNEVYFAELARDLAALVASVCAHYARSTSTPRDVLLSLPGMTVERVDRTLGHAAFASGAVESKAQRNAMLDLLEGVRGKSIWEESRIGAAPGGGGSVNNKGTASASAKKSKWIDGGVDTGMDGVDTGAGGAATGIVRGGTPELDGVSDLFG